MSTARKVKYAKFHGEIFVPDVGSLQNTLPSKTKNYPGLNMYWETDGLHVKLTARKKVGNIEVPYTTEILVPSASVLLVQYDETVESAKAVEPKKAA